MTYFRNFCAMGTRFLNAVFGGDQRNESVSGAVGRKAGEGRRGYIIAEAFINVPFAFLGERDHCQNRIER